MIQALSTEGYSETDMQNMFAGARFSAEAFALHRSTFDAREFATKLDVPVFIFQGERDIKSLKGSASENSNIPMS